MSRRSRRLIAIALAGGAALGFATPPAGDAAPRARAAACAADHGPRVATSGPEAAVHVEGVTDNGKRHPAPRISPQRFSDLVVVVKWTHVDLNHWQRVSLVGPDGHVYQTTTALVSPAGAFQRTSTVETVVPLRGSWILDYNLYGGWCAEVYLDDEGAPVARAGFTIAPSR